MTKLKGHSREIYYLSTPLFPHEKKDDTLKSSSLTLDRSEVGHNEAELVAAHGVDAAVHADLDPLPLLLHKEKILTLKCNYLEFLP